MEYAVEMIGLTKRYGALLANDHVDLRVRKGTVHAVVGENGAGKTTLMNMLYGLVRPDEGEICVDGQKAVFYRPHDAMKLGIGMVHQHFMQVQSFSILENVMLGKEPRTRWSTIDRRAARIAIGELSQRFGLEADLDTPIRDLPVGMRQRVEIIKLLYRGARIIIMDEPTANLSPQGTDELLEELRKLNREGKTILFISHKLPEVLDISDAITVLRKGRAVADLDARSATESQLVDLIIGRHDGSADRQPTARRAAPQKTVLQAEGLCVAGPENAAVRNVSFDVRGGEIVAVAGVEGNGQSELSAALLGLIPLQSGAVRLHGVDCTRMSVMERRRLGMAFVPEDRSGEGLALEASICENAILGVHYKYRPIGRGAFIDWRRAAGFSSGLANDYAIKTPGHPRLTPASSLSGGNMQKLLIGRELAADTDCLVVVQPTQGLDIGAKKAVYDVMFRKRDAGCAILVVSTDLDEVFEIADRILVMYKGEVAAELTRDETTPQEVGLYMTGLRGPLSGAATDAGSEGSPC